MRYSKSFLLGTDWKGGENPFHHSRGVDTFLDFGSTNPEQTTTTIPYGSENYDELYAGASDWFKSGGADLYGNPLTAGQNMMQLDAQQGIGDYITGAQFTNPLNYGSKAASDILYDPYGGTNYSDLTSDPSQYGLTSANANPALRQQLSGDPFQNPALEDTIQSVEQGIMEDYQRNRAPLDRANITYNQPGGSSKGDILQANSEDNLFQNMLNARADMTFGGYEKALNRQDSGIMNQMRADQLGEQSRSTRANEGLNRFAVGTQGYGSLADTAQGGYASLYGFGDAQQAFDQQLVDEQAFRWDWDQNQPYRAQQQYAGILSGANPGGGTQTTEMDDGTSAMSQMIPMALGIAALAASDRRLKKNIRKIGQLLNGLFIYTYQYIWGGPLEIGVMADEAKKVFPHAVTNIGGYDYVDYAVILKGRNYVT